MLTEEQKLIVQNDDQHILCVANAGTGKTFTVIEKLDHLINKQNILPERILLTSFSRVASNELYEKALKKVGIQKADKIMIGTLHAICYKVVLENLDKCNLKAINIVNESYLSAIAFNKHPDIFKARKEAVKVTSMYRRELLLGKEQRPDRMGLAEFNAIKEAQTIMEADNKILFDDLMIKTVQLFNKYPEINKTWTDKFDIIICDEVQDTNLIQWTIIDLLRTFETRTMMVGDAKQNIYAFRGCQHGYMTQHRTRNNSKVFTLSETFRFGQNFANLSNRIIENLELDSIYKKETVTNVDCTNEPEFHALSTESQVQFIFEDIVKKQASGISYKDFNIVYRYNKESLPFMKKFIEERIPFETKSGDIFERAELKFVLRSYGLLKDFRISDCIELFGMFPNFIGDKTLTKVYNDCPAKGSVIELLDFAVRFDIEGVGFKKKQSLSEMKARFNALNRYIHSEIQDRPQFIDIANIMNMDETKFMLKESEENENPSEDRYAFLDFFQENYNKSECKNPLDWFTEVSLNGHKVKEKVNDKVQLKTIHGCKGQSLPIVYLVANRICDPMFINNEEDIENEKYVLYVSCTRAESYLGIFINSPESFRFNFIYNKDWKEKYTTEEGKPLRESGVRRRVGVDSQTGVYSIPDNIMSQIKDNYKIKKKNYKSMINEKCIPVSNTERAIQFSQRGENIWLPISLLGYDDNRFFLEDWVITKNKYGKYVEKY